MRILLSNHSLNRMGGSETWTFTMWTELQRLGHEVHVYTPNPITAWKAMQPYDGRYYDLAILNHRATLQALRQKPLGKIVFTSHGVIPGAEKPEEGAHVYVSVSEEVQEALQKQGFHSTVIRNPIDVDYFNTEVSPPQTPTGVLFLSNNPPKVANKIASAVKKMGLAYEAYGRGFQIPQSKLVEKMSQVSHVISLGRGAYEGMSMARNVIVMDYNGADGIATPESLLEFRKNNCSGRRYGLPWAEQEVQDAIAQYNPELGPYLREYVIANNNVKDIAERYLCL